MAEKDKEEAVYVQPTSVQDLEARQKAADEGKPNGAVLGGAFDPDSDDPVLNPNKVYAPYALEDNDTSAYVGVSPEYMNYANETEKPLRADGGPQQRAEEEALGFGAVSTSSTPEGEQTEGGGSTRELVYSATSGEDWVPEVVDREKVHAQAEKDAAARESGETPARQPAKKAAATKSTSSNE